MHEKKKTQLYLHDIADAIIAIEKYTARLSFEKYSKDQKTIDAVIRNFEIIGEAANNISKEFIQSRGSIPWDKMIAMRNKMIHEYFGVDQSILWTTIKEDLPVLKKQIIILMSQKRK